MLSVKSSELSVLRIVEGTLNLELLNFFNNERMITLLSGYMVGA